MSYSHAAELAARQPPQSQLRYLVSELKRWADVNPQLKPLHAEFARVAAELDAAPQAPAVLEVLCACLEQTEGAQYTPAEASALAVKILLNHLAEGSRPHELLPGA